MFKSRHELKLEALRRVGLIRTPQLQPVKVEDKSEKPKKATRKKKGD